MKKKNARNLRLVKRNISKLEVKEIHKLKGGDGSRKTGCNTCFDCWLH